MPQNGAKVGRSLFTYEKEKERIYMCKTFFASNYVALDPRNPKYTAINGALVGFAMHRPIIPAAIYLAKMPSR